MVVETTLLPPGFLLEAKDDMMVRWLGKSLIMCAKRICLFVVIFSKLSRNDFSEKNAYFNSYCNEISS